MQRYEKYKKNAERWEMKEAFDNFFGKVKRYMKMRIDQRFNKEINFIMDQIWTEQIRKPSQYYVTD